MKLGNYNPSLLPEFPGMPDEIPRLQIQTDTGFNLSMSNARVDLILDLPFGLEKGDQALFFENVNLLLDILNDHGFDYSRVGLVRRFFHVMNEPEKLIASRFGGREGDDLTDYSVNAMRRANISGVECKNIFNISNGIIRGVEPGLVAFRDLNVNPNQTVFTRVGVQDFVKAANELLTLESLVEFSGE